MKSLSPRWLVGLGALCLSSLSAGCHATGEHATHWSNRSLSSRVSYQMLGYKPEHDGDYRDFHWRDKQAINLAFRRHFLLSNPDHPLQPDDPNLRKPRPANSLFPYPWHYFNAGLAGSVIGTMNPGGMDEFMDGIETTFHPVGVVVASFANHTIGRDGPIIATWTKIASIAD